MSKKANCCRFLVLLIPGLLTLGFLIFSLVTDNWIRIVDEPILNEFQKNNEIEFENFTKTLDHGKTNIDYFYVEKLWPLIRRRSLYSKCLEYKKFYLKLSTSYFTLNKKPTIRSSIVHYPKYAQKLYEKYKNEKHCNGTGWVKCYLTDECVEGALCDGVSDCNDQSDEQFCEVSQCKEYEHQIKFHCDSKCWKYSQVCKQTEPTCVERKDETSLCDLKSKFTLTETTDDESTATHNETKLKLSQDKYVPDLNCYLEYFDFKSAKELNKLNLNYLTQNLADSLQNELNHEYHLNLIFILSYCSAILFAIFALLTLIFLLCFSKLCLQCPFWFYGFFSILTFLACLASITTFLYNYYMNIQKLQEPLKQLPLISEFNRMNPHLAQLQTFCMSFWSACAATLCSFLSMFLSFIVCCRLKSNRHQDKVYKVMHIQPTY